jgi:hypothetical protein
MEPRDTPSEVDTARSHGVLVNDEDLLSASTQHAVEDMASILGVILVVAMFMANLAAPQRRSRVLADFVVGLFARASKQDGNGHPIADGPPVSRTNVTRDQCAAWVSDDRAS